MPNYTALIVRTYHRELRITLDAADLAAAAAKIIAHIDDDHYDVAFKTHTKLEFDHETYTDLEEY